MVGEGDIKVTFVCEACDITYVRLANKGESVTPPTPPNLTAQNLEYVETIGNYQNLQHDEVCVFKYKTTDNTTRVGIVLNDATGYNMADFWVYCATGATITVTHADGTVISNIGTNAYFNFNHDYTGWTEFDTGEIIIDTDSGLGSYYFAELTSSIGGVDSNIQNCVQYVYMSDYINFIPTNFLKYSILNNIVTTNSSSGTNIMGSRTLNKASSLNIVVIPIFITEVNGGFLQCYDIETNKTTVFYRNAVTLEGDSLNYPSLIEWVDFGYISQIGDRAYGRGKNAGSNLKTVIFNTTAPPTIASSSFLAQISKLCVIYVPLASLTAYKTNTNMVHLADQMIGY